MSGKGKILMHRISGKHRLSPIREKSLKKLNELVFLVMGKWCPQAREMVGH